MSRSVLERSPSPFLCPPRGHLQAGRTRLTLAGRNCMSARRARACSRGQARTAMVPGACRRRRNHLGPRNRRGRPRGFCNLLTTLRPALAREQALAGVRGLKRRCPHRTVIVTIPSTTRTTNTVTAIRTMLFITTALLLACPVVDFRASRQSTSLPGRAHAGRQALSTATVRTARSALSAISPGAGEPRSRASRPSSSRSAGTTNRSAPCASA